MATNRAVALAVAALAFGIAYVVVRGTVETLPPLTLVGWRFLLAGVPLLVLAFPTALRVWRDGLIGGSLLFAGYTLQTYGLAAAPAASVAAVTGVAIVVAPLMAAGWHRTRPSPWSVTSAILAAIGLTLLGPDQRLGIGAGEALALGGALAFAAHLVWLSLSAQRHPVIPYTAVQVTVTGLLGVAAASVFETPRLPTGPEWGAVVGLGLGIGAGAYLIQAWAQTSAGAGRPDLVLGLIPVLAVAVALLTGERPAPLAWLGVALVVVAANLIRTRDTDPALQAAESVTPGH
jgi:drug/metabolite transporter (DMT)-like permease